MNTLAWLLILMGALIVRGATKGRGLSDIPGDLGDLFTAAINNDTTALKEVLGRTGDILSSDTGSVPVGPYAQFKHFGAYKLGPVTKQLQSAADEVGNKFAIQTIGGWRASDPYPDHPSGHAADFMVGDDKAKGDAVAAYLMANAQRLNVKYIIWYQRSWTPGRGWKNMADRGSPTQNHKDHVHLTVN